MRKILSLLCLIVISCSSDSSDEEIETEVATDPVDLSIDLDRTVFGIDERITINASSREQLTRGCIGSDFFNPARIPITRCFNSSNLGREFHINLSFPSVGTKTFFVEAQTGDLRVGRIERQIEIDSFTNSVRVKKVTINDYTGKGRPLDDVVSDTDPERFADLYFNIQKRFIKLSVADENTPLYDNVDFISSTVLPNETGFELNFDGNELLLSKDVILFFSLFDEDPEFNGDGIIDDLFIIFNDFAEEKPEQINVTADGSRLDITLDVEWN